MHRVDQTLRESFKRVELAHRYRAWLLDQVRPWLGRRVLEVGCGVGNITAELLALERVVAIDAEPAYLDELHRRLGRPDNLRTEALAVEDEALAQLRAEELDCAVMLNVLEHIDDDVGALRNLARALRPGSPVVVQVPAHRWLTGAADEALGHRRRYRRDELGAALSASGLDPERIWQFNALGVVGWLVSGRVLRQTMFSEGQLWLYEALVPLIRRLEPGSGVPIGLSLMAVGRRQ